MHVHSVCSPVDLRNKPSRCRVTVVVPSSCRSHTESYLSNTNGPDGGNPTQFQSIHSTDSLKVGGERGVTVRNQREREQPEVTTRTFCFTANSSAVTI